MAQERVFHKLPTPELVLTNKSAFPDNHICLDNSGRFLFQLTYEALFLHDLVWKIRRKIELPESRSWLLFVMLLNDDRILIAHKETFEKTRILLCEAQLNYEKMCTHVIRKHSFPISDLQSNHPPFQSGPSDWVQQLSSRHAGIFANFCDGGRNLWIVDGFEPSKRQLILIPPEIRFVRFAVLIDQYLYFFGDSLHKIWHLKRIYAININSGTVAEIPLSSVMKGEDQIANIHVTDGAWNYVLQRLCLTLYTRKDGVVERHLLVLDLRSRMWKHLDVSAECSDSSILDVKHRVDHSNDSILLILNQALKFTNKTLIHRISVREPARLSELAFAAVLRANPQFSRLKANQFQALGLSTKLYPLFRPVDRFMLIRLTLFWFICCFSAFGVLYYFTQIIMLSYAK